MRRVAALHKLGQGDVGLPGVEDQWGSIDPVKPPRPPVDQRHGTDGRGATGRRGTRRPKAGRGHVSTHAMMPIHARTPSGMHRNSAVPLGNSAAGLGGASRSPDRVKSPWRTQCGAGWNARMVIVVSFLLAGRHGLVRPTITTRLVEYCKGRFTLNFVVFMEDNSPLAETGHGAVSAETRMQSVGYAGSSSDSATPGSPPFSSMSASVSESISTR